MTFDVDPRTSSMCASTGFRAPAATTGFVWPDLAVDELHVFTEVSQHRLRRPGSYLLHASPLARRLQVYASGVLGPGDVSARGSTLESLELSLLPTDTMKGVPASNAIVERGQFQRADDVARDAPSKSPRWPVHRSLHSSRSSRHEYRWRVAETWVAARPRFPRLRTLVARGWFRAVTTTARHADRRRARRHLGRAGLRRPAAGLSTPIAAPLACRGWHDDDRRHVRRIRRRSCSTQPSCDATASPSRRDARAASAPLEKRRRRCSSSQRKPEPARGARRAPRLVRGAHELDRRRTTTRPSSPSSSMRFHAIKLDPEPPCPRSRRPPSSTSSVW